MKEFTEKQTREELIDKALRKSSWLHKYIKEEVNSVKSNFKTKEFVMYSSKNIEKGVDKFIDYLLLNEQSMPLAIIEAKKFSVDAKKGRIQARSYQEDIYNQIGYKVPIFLTNGREWLFIDQDGVERKIIAPFSQQVLERRLNLYLNRKDLRLIKVNPKIVDRDRSISILSELKNHFEQKYKKALLSMATGTGKTRVSMGLIDILIKGNYVQNVLFVADRISLANQAKQEGFSEFFNEPVSNIREDGFDTTKRLYVTTIQTMMSKKDEKFFFEQFNCGFFDLIIFDEAHRSIYDKNNKLMEYFDAMYIGLTATPKSSENRNTYALFECVNDEPTVEYSYDDAVRDGVLVTFRAQIIETDVLSQGIIGNKLDDYLKDELRRQEESEPDKIEFSGKQFAKVFMDDDTNKLIITEFMNRCYRSDDNKPCKSIFFCASQKHAQHIKTLFGKLFPHLSNDVQVITSDEYRAQDEIHRFKQQSSPRIALSVGMLDTGVDIPEVMNLVFVKPVFSPQRFWQMVGRGTRNIKACKHKAWLPSQNKQDFLILDFAIGGFSNFEFHKLKRTSKDSVESLMKRMFDARLELLNKNISDEQKEVLHRRIYEDIESLGEESYMVQDKLGILQNLKQEGIDYSKHIEELEDDVSKLMILKQMGNPQVASFVSVCERLFKHILELNYEEIEKIKQSILEKIEILLEKKNLEIIKMNEKVLVSLFDENFWSELTFSKVEFLIKDIAPLMQFYEKAPAKMYQIDKKDSILQEREFEKAVEKDGRVEKFLKDNPIALKLKKGEGILPKEIRQLEEELKKLGYGFSVEEIQKMQGKDFIDFLYEMIGESPKYSSKEEMGRAFNEFIIENSHYSQQQLEFLELLKKVFMDRKVIELKDLSREPFKDETHVFNFPELVAVVDKINELRWR
ncbi:MAG: DEAD/DEAH box helicase family protein [Nanoarchaeota archaeon]|nr:DEAD/DEAH box helicase family protein [Nanoarchaeota archaeon]